MLQHLYHLQEVKNKRKFTPLGRVRFREVLAYKRFQIWTFSILENRRRGDRLREVVATGGSTVISRKHKNNISLS